MPSIVLARCRYKNRQVPLSKGLQPSRAIAKWVGNFNTEWYTLFLVVCIRFYDIRKGTAIWTRRGAYKQRLPFNVNSLKKKIFNCFLLHRVDSKFCSCSLAFEPSIKQQELSELLTQSTCLFISSSKEPEYQHFFFISSF